MQEVQLWAMIGTGTGLGLHLFVLVAWFVLVFAVVGKNRPDAARTLLISLSISALLTCVGPIVTPALGFYATRSGGPESFIRVQAVAQIVMSVIAVAPQALLMAAVAQLARPARRDVRDPDLSSLGA